MMPLVFSLWKVVMEHPTTTGDKLISLGAVLHVYSALLGMTEEDFYDWAHELGETYSGPLPDGYSQEVLEHYKELRKHE
jgi:hypothetical protein